MKILMLMQAINQARLQVWKQPLEFFERPILELDKRFVGEWNTEFDYQPGVCNRTYRMVAARKRIETDLAGERLFEEYLLTRLLMKPSPVASRSA